MISSDDLTVFSYIVGAIDDFVHSIGLDMVDLLSATVFKKKRARQVAAREKRIATWRSMVLARAEEIFNLAEGE